ncbi:hypothetical protein ACIF9R_26545 [Streptomyces sp. NPDC086080]|uniref:hypothetical protein n=1 Tax=Streptomyces sp. NPDC086080 TaxID=3365748 RepID=UPI0037D23B1A
MASRRVVQPISGLELAGHAGHVDRLGHFGAGPGRFACRADVEIVASRVPEGEARDRLHRLAGRDR